VQAIILASRNLIFASHFAYIIVDPISEISVLQLRTCWSLISHCCFGHFCLCVFQAARETGALKEAKDKLEKTVEELTWRLQLEKRLRVLLIPIVFALILC